MRASIAAVGLVVAAAATAQDEVPFVTTPEPVTVAMLELAKVGPRDHVIDLGSGDGRIVITAAKRFGASGLGVEIVGDLVRRSRDSATRAGVADRAEFREQDLFATDLSRATVVTMYLLPEVNLQLRPRLLALAPGTRIVSHDWDLGDWAPDARIVVDAPDKPIGREKRSTLMLWTVPARLHGSWCTAGGRIDVVQRFQEVSAALMGEGSVPLLVFDGRLDGALLRARGNTFVEARVAGDELHLQRVAAAGSAFEGRRFRRC